MDFNDDKIEYLMSLSKLQLTTEEKEQTKRDLEAIVKFMSELGDVRPITAEETKPSNFNVFDEDYEEVTDECKREALLSNSGRIIDGAFVVPRTFGGSEGEDE